MSKINVKITNLRIRATPSLKGKVVGYATKGVHTYTKTKDADGYTWYMIDEDAWVAGIEGDVELIEETTVAGKINIKIDNLRMREKATTKSSSKGFATKGVHEYSETSKADGYTWYRIENGYWVAGIDGDVEEFEDEPDVPVPAWLEPESVDPDTNSAQIHLSTKVRIRFSPSTSAESMALANANTYYNVLSIVNGTDYTWYEVGVNAWIAGVEEVEYIPEGVPKDYDLIIENVEELKSTLDTAIKAIENKKCVDYYKELQSKTTELNEFIKKNFNYIDYDYEDDKEYNEIDLIYTTDIHGYWKGYQESTRVQTNFSINDLNTLKNNLKKQGIPSLLVNSGDIIHGSDTANANYGEDVVKAFNNLDMFASVFGNHEFRYNDEGPWFQTRMKALESMTACNLLYKDTGKLVFKPYRLARFGSKVIGVIGVGFPGFDGGRGNTDEYTILDGLDCCKQIQKYINELRELGANYIFCAVHLGDGTDARAGNNISVPIIANNTEGLDAILPGHSHAMTEQHTEINSKGNPVIVLAQPRCDLMYISRVRIKKDGITSELLDTI